MIEVFIKKGFLISTIYHVHLSKLFNHKTNQPTETARVCVKLASRVSVAVKKVVGKYSHNQHFSVDKLCALRADAIRLEIGEDEPQPNRLCKQQKK